MLTRNGRLGAVLLAIVAAGVGLRTVQYAAGAAFWLDEIALVQGILGADLIGLLAHPLPHDQVAPKGFLLLQKLAVLAFGPGDGVLRLVPFVSSLVALAAFWRVALRLLPPAGAVVATLLFATAAPFIILSAVSKQYSTDVCVAVLLTWLAHELIARPVTRRKSWFAALAGAALVWLSHPAVLMVTALAVPLALWLRAGTPGDRPRLVLIILGIWGASALAAALVSHASMSPATREYMHVFWAGGMAPDSLAGVIEQRWPWKNVKHLFRSGGGVAGLAYPFSPLYPLLAVAGYYLLWKKQRQVAVMLIVPLALTLAAAAARRYPFSDRLILFLVPSLMLAVAAAIAAIHGAVARRSVAGAALLAALLTLPALAPVAGKPPPYRVEDLKALLARMQTTRQPADAMYVYYAAAPVFSAYAAQFGISRDGYAVGGCHRGDSRRYLEELDTFRGRARAWIVITHAVGVYREREDILAYLDAIGSRKDQFRIDSYAVGRNPGPAEAYLYDLSDPSKLARANSRHFLLTGPDSVVGRFGCANGPQALIPPDFECANPPGTRCTRRPTR